MTSSLALATLLLTASAPLSAAELPVLRCAGPPPPAPLRQPPPPGSGALRDAYELPNLDTSAHFALRWGDQGDLSGPEIDEILDSLERAWEVLVDDLGMPAPLGSEAHLFNVYLADTGDGAPDSAGAAGYYTFDRQGWPMIVLSPYVTQDLSYGRSVIAHELFHALQSATGSYEYTEASNASWFWEASAEWASSEVYPEDPYYASFLAAFAFYPHLALDYFDYPDQGRFIEGYQYGAFVFPRYLSEVRGRPDLVRDAWIAPGDADDPLAAIAAGLAGEGTDLLPLIADFYARNAAWDYEDGSLYEDIVDLYGGYYADQDFQVATWEDIDDDGSWREGPAEVRPERYGANRVELASSGACGVLSLAFDGLDTGSAGSEAAWAGVAVRHRSGAAAADYRVLDDEQTVEIDLDGAVREVSLVVVPASAVRVRGETFAYAYAWSFQPAADREAAGCTSSSGGTTGPGGLPGGGGLGDVPEAGCRHSPGRPGAWIWMLSLLGVVGMMKRRKESHPCWT